LFSYTLLFNTPFSDLHETIKQRKVDLDRQKKFEKKEMKVIHDNLVVQKQSIKEKELKP